MNFHGYTHVPQYTGWETGSGPGSGAKGPSVDQIAADVIGVGTKQRLLNLRVQPLSYISRSEDRGIISYDTDASRMRQPRDLTPPPSATPVASVAAKKGWRG